MPGSLLFVVTLAAALGAGLNAGVFFAFSTFVMKALERLPTAQGIAAMQSINVAVLNPSFLTVLLGTAALCIGLAARCLFGASTGASPYLLAGSALYLLGTLAVTIAGNVPRNDALAALDPGSAQAALVWARTVPGWNRWNHVRTAAALLAALCFTLGLLRLVDE